MEHTSNNSKHKWEGEGKKKEVNLACKMDAN